MKRLPALCLVLSFLLGRLSCALAAGDAMAAASSAYSLLYESPRIRVLELKITKGQKVALHSQPAHLVYVVEPGHLNSTLENGIYSQSDYRAGEILPRNAEIHAFENTGNTDFKAIIFEFK